VSWYQKGKIYLFLLKQESEWQWHQLGRMQVCTSLQTDNYASTHYWWGGATTNDTDALNEKTVLF